ncbi:PRC and DUF2382 domain-containing protein [Brevibacterium luteolum]|uniref:PRC and DUF2382 domain-containing protein n=1 Tax=Brevibacterium luteolum TaxID=199591 RepID=UPI00223A9181|nr:PRC and DUF2382 domain-containing protein [Brevibacterium luteolum]MCT1874701.1 PRC and DUF2382 domain-containing protein [Brevibacterium luteolum]MCT1890805.1 PRC and DUF2382 domain-containing protein [Brevibacterium luteolum]MCT1894387.1 PRC and DUF2382 domain-containing protein [Brevibacterium luteolum]MCT1924575.1 PRC and DUF2382 domain-containing protein [Brevibacterium luteolum]
MENIDIDRLRGSDLYDQTGSKIGSIGEVYLDDQTNEPAFVTVNTGLFGMNETFVPYQSVTRDGDNLVAPFEKSFVKDAPNIAADGSLTPEEEEEIFRYYQLDSGTGRDRDRDGVRDHDRHGKHDADRDGVRDAGVAGAAGGVAGAAGHDRDHDRHGKHDLDRDGVRDHDRAAAAGDQQQVVAHEERLNVGKEQVETGKVRLRKHVVTENQQVEVPVQREELVVERESIDPNSPEARKGGGIDADRGAVDETVTLREERPVVDKETVATEKVNVGKRVVEDKETVGGEVRKEQIDIDGAEGRDAAGRGVDGRGVDGRGVDGPGPDADGRPLR